jgi:hypothetical protein
VEFKPQLKKQGAEEEKDGDDEGSQEETEQKDEALAEVS